VIPVTTTPQSTARLQFFAGFTMDDAVRIIPYLADLGISHLYASPLLKARPGSTHCYDIVDHDEINPELGGEQALHRMVAALRTHGMGLIVDIVPNHMGVGGADNSWWLDILEWGRISPYAEYFDIDWEPPDISLHGKLLAPFLGSAYGEALAKGELALQCDCESGSLFVGYHEHRFPISPRSAALVLHGEPVLNEVSHAFASAVRLPNRVAAREAVKHAKAMLVEIAASPVGAAAISAVLSRFAGKSVEEQSRLHELLERQHFRLVWWRAASDEINWRRFFDINTLAGLRVEVPRVFDATHRKILQLYAEGLIDGVRIDHVDGLADPRLYCRKLRRSMETAGAKRPPGVPQGPPYIVVEKILAPRERLAADWLTDGTTGYDFMDQVAGVLHDPAGEAALTWMWASLTSRSGDFFDEEQAARRQILSDNLASELNANAAALHRIAKRDLMTRDYTLTTIRRALTEILVHFPVYRIYAGRAGKSDIDVQVMDRAVAGARRGFRAADRQLLDVLRRWLVDESPRSVAAGPRRSERLRAMVRFQQLSAPVAAKSVEDTSFYRYGRLLSRNEVGSHPSQFSLTVAAFHAACTERQKRQPGAMVATATHDHKRGEDTRARLAVLSEIPGEWETAVNRWMRLNAIIRRENAPSAADEIMLYQTLVAGWPIGLAPEDLVGVELFRNRVSAWFEKSMREAKLFSEWAAPNAAYEMACQDFLVGTLDPSRPVLGEIVAFANRLNLPGALNGLSQTLLRLTVPGVPDMYQGTEFWDQSLVDPDNRRPVDYAGRIAALSRRNGPKELLSSWQTGEVKQAVIANCLSLRKQQPDLFAHGNYLKLEAEGPAAEHVLAFSRRFKNQKIVVAVSRLSAQILVDRPLIPGSFWAGTQIVLPAGGMRNVLTGDNVKISRIPVADLLCRLPVALLTV
jgi:(1->4)-alpha-D-glucan 1-alpha-D-glucosylmutase